MKSLNELPIEKHIQYLERQKGNIENQKLLTPHEFRTWKYLKNEIERLKKKLEMKSNSQNEIKMKNEVGNEPIIGIENELELENEIRIRNELQNENETQNELKMKKTFQNELGTSK